MKQMSSIDHDRLVEFYLTGWWPKTRAAVVHRFVQRADRLLALVREAEALDDELGRRVDAEIAHVLTEAIGKPWATPMSARQRAIWEAARATCPDRRVLLRLIAGDQAVRGFSSITPAHALGRLLKSHLDACHWEVLGVTEHRARVWSKLRRISDELLREYQVQHGRAPPPGHRCSAPHFRDIRTRILRDELHDARIAEIKVGTIEEYFGRLCRECRQLVPLEDSLLDGASLPDDANDLKARLIRMLKRAIDELDEPLQHVIRIAYLGEPTISSLSAPDTDPSEFERLRHEALRQLRYRLDFPEQDR